MSLEEQTFSDYRSRPTPDRLRAVLRTQEDRVYNLCYQVLHHAQDAEDTAQKVLLKLVEGIGDLPDAAALRRWLYRVSVTKALDARTERARRRAREREVAFMKKTETASQSEDAAGDLVAAIGSLEANLGELILRHYFEKCTLKDLATEERVSEVAIWKRIEKGKDKLRELLASQGSVMSMAALDLRLSSIVPVRAPAALTAGLLAGKAGMSLTKGAVTAAKTASTVKIVAASIGLLAIGLGLAAQGRSTRARLEALQARAPAVDARRPLEEPGAARPPLPATAGSALPAAPDRLGPKPVPDASPAGSPEDGLRERMRKVIRIKLKLNAGGGRDLLPDPESQKEIEALQAELAPTLQSPMSDPHGFGRIFRLTYEVAFEELGDPLSESQKASLAAGLARMQGAMEQGRTDPVRDLRIDELKGYRELIEGLRPLSDSQLRKLEGFTSPATFLPIHETHTIVLNGIDDPAAEVLREWTRKLPLEAPQQTIAGSAARTFVESWERIDRQFEAQYGYPPGIPPADAPLLGFLNKVAAILNYAISMQEAQRDALRLLEGALGPEQLSQLRNTPMVQFQRATVIRRTTVQER